jgi:hypothetical protein
VALKRASVDIGLAEPLTGEEKNGLLVRLGGEGELEGRGAGIARRIDEIAREGEHRSSRDAGFGKTCMIGFGIVGLEDEGRKSFLAMRSPKGGVTGDEDVSAGDCGCNRIRIRDRKRLEKCVVGEIDAGVFCSERMAAGRRNGEAEAGETRPRLFQIGHGKHAMVEPPRAGGGRGWFCHGHHVPALAPSFKASR